MKMNREEVLYDGKRYLVIFRYTSGYLEIQEKDSRFTIQLVHRSEVQPVCPKTIIS